MGWSFEFCVDGHCYVAEVVDLSISMKWSMGSLGGTIEMTKEKIVMNVERGIGRMMLRALRGKGMTPGQALDMARLMACMFKMPVELRMHGVKAMTVRCG